MNFKVLILLAIFFCAVHGDDGLCSADGLPADGGSCSGGGDGSNDQEEDSKEPKVIQFEGKDETEEEKERLEKFGYWKLSYTNDYDFKIRDLLDSADDLIAFEPEEAIKRCNEILKDHPKSMRAKYAIARSMQFINVTEWDESKIEKHNRDIFNRLKEMMSIGKDISTDTLYNSITHNALVQTLTLNDTEAAIDVLQTALALRSGSNEFYHQLLVQNLFLEERYEEALATIEKALEDFHWNKVLKFFKGIVLKRLGRKKEANALLRNMEADSNDVFQFGTIVSNLCDDLLRRKRSHDFDLILKEASKIHLFMSRYQRPMEAYPELESKPVWDLEEDVGLTTHDDLITALKENLAEIRSEALSLRRNESVWTKVQGIHLKEENGEFEEFPLFSFGKKRHYNCELMPRTCQLLKQFKTCQKCTTKLNVLPPKSHILARTGPTNTRLRMHVPLQTPSETSKAKMRIGKNQILEWSADNILVFDDTYEHELWNEDEDEERIVLNIDIPHPDAKDITTAFNYAAKQNYEFF